MRKRTIPIIVALVFFALALSANITKAEKVTLTDDICNKMLNEGAYQSTEGEGYEFCIGKGSICDEETTLGHSEIRTRSCNDIIEEAFNSDDDCLEKDYWALFLCAHRNHAFFVGPSKNQGTMASYLIFRKDRDDSISALKESKGLLEEALKRYKNWNAKEGHSDCVNDPEDAFGRKVRPDRFFNMCSMLWQDAANVFYYLGYLGHRGYYLLAAQAAEAVANMETQESKAGVLYYDSVIAYTAAYKETSNHDLVEKARNICEEHLLNQKGDPSPEVYLHACGIVFQLLGDFQRALELYEKALNSGNNYLGRDETNSQYNDLLQAILQMMREGDE